MKVLFIGPYSLGSTSKMRVDCIKNLLPINDYKLIDIEIPFYATNKIFRSIGWKYKVGPMMQNINNYILNVINGDFSYDLVWVDKGVFINPDIIAKLRKLSTKLVHYTPDPAFVYHQSNLFFKAIPYYDYCITTKSYEVDEYKKRGIKTILCTQGFDPTIHKSYHNFDEKNGVIFIGHYEKERASVISKLIDAKITINIAGIGWENMAKKYQRNKYFNYKGVGIHGIDYAKEISSSLMSLGLLSKWIPEKHTTRTFEIPACKTVLITERTDEIENFFDESDVIYFENENELPDKINRFMENPNQLEIMAENAFQKLLLYRLDHMSIVKELLIKTACI